MDDNGMYFDGQTMEKEYEHKQNGRPNRFHTLKCRMAAGNVNKYNFIIVFFVLLVCQGLTDESRNS